MHELTDRENGCKYSPKDRIQFEFNLLLPQSTSLPVDM